MADTQEPSRPNKKSSPSNDYLKYSSLAIQLLATIAISGWIGYKLDQYLDLKFPAFMLVLGFAGFGGMLYQVYKSINRP